MARLMGRWDDDGLLEAALRFDAAGMECLAWRFLDEQRVIVGVRPPEHGRDVSAMSQAARAVGARLAAPVTR